MNWGELQDKTDYVMNKLNDLNKYVMTAEEFINKNDLNPNRKTFTRDDVIKLCELYHAEKFKEMQFDAFCNPDLYEASANEHFEQEERKQRVIEVLSNNLALGNIEMIHINIDKLTDELC